MPMGFRHCLVRLALPLGMVIAAPVLGEEAPVFAQANPSATETSTLNTPPDSLSRVHAQVNLEALRQHDRVRFLDEAGHELLLHSSSRESQGRDHQVWRGQVLRDDRALGGATLRMEGDRIHGILRSQEGSFRITGDSERGYVIDRIDPGSIPASHPPVDLPTEKGKKTEGINLETTEDEKAVVDVLAYYTSAAVDEFDSEADLRLAIRSWVDQANTALINSDIDHRFRLLGIFHRDHVEDPEDMPSSLNNFRMDNEVNRLRGLYAADLQTQYGVFTDFCGIAGLLTDYYEDWGFGYSTNNAYAGYPCGFINVLGHELGHNLGLHHNPEIVSDPENTIEPFAFGHFVEDHFSTVMSYHSGCGGGEYHNCGFSIDYFSNPEIEDPSYGFPLGVEGERDNAEVLRRTMPLATGWREMPIEFEDLAGGHFHTEGEGLWVIQDQVSFEGDPAFISGPVYGDEESRLILERDNSEGFTMTLMMISDPAESGRGRLTIKGDDEEITTIDHFTEFWLPYEVEVPEGTDRITWVWTSTGRPSADEGLGVISMSTDIDLSQSTSGSSSSSSGCSLMGESRLDPALLFMLLLSMGILLGRTKSTRRH